MIPHWLIVIGSAIPVTGIIGYLWQRNNAYGLIIEEFKEKLPRPQNQAQVLTAEQIKANPFLPDSFQHITVINTGTQKISLSDSDLDTFYNKLVNFDYRFVLFANYYRKYTKNLLRFHPKTNHNNFDLAVLQRVLQDDSEIHQTKFLGVLKYQLKWHVKPFSSVNIFFVKRREKKRIEKFKAQFKRTK